MLNIYVLKHSLELYSKTDKSEISERFKLILSNFNIPLSKVPTRSKMKTCKDETDITTRAARANKYFNIRQ